MDDAQNKTGGGLIVSDSLPPAVPNLFKRRTELDSQAFSTSWSPIEQQIGKLSWTQDVDKKFQIDGKKTLEQGLTPNMQTATCFTSFAQP